GSRLAGGEPPYGELATHGRWPGLGVAKRDPFGKLVATVRMTRGGDRHERAVDREAVPQHAVEDVLRGMEHADRLGSLEQVERAPGMEEIGAGPDVRVRDDHGFALVPVDPVEVRDRPAADLPVPEPADGDARRALPGPP